MAILKASDWLNLVKLECICETLILTQGLENFDQTALTLFLWGQMIYIVLVLFKSWFDFFFPSPFLFFFFLSVECSSSIFNNVAVQIYLCFED